MEIIIKENKKIVIAMSGGVDSSVAASLLKEEGYEVTGVMLKIWDDVSKCCSLQDITDAKKVADQLNIPFYVKEHQKSFKKEVVDNFIETYLKGHTPLPCSHCNEKIKFPLIIQEAEKLGVNLMATGHYAQIKKLEDGSYSLFKGVDSHKDQTYFLFRLNQNMLKHILFPIGTYKKEQIREIANKLQIETANKAESQEVCFVNDDYKGFIESQVPANKIKRGLFYTTEGRIVGKHDGIYKYTIGQRKGLNVAVGHPLYVIDINGSTGTILLGNEDELYKETVKAINLNWLNKVPETGEKIIAKIRYSHKGAIGTITSIDKDNIEVKFDEPQRAVTKGQALVLYKEDELLGGGFIV